MVCVCMCVCVCVCPCISMCFHVWISPICCYCSVARWCWPYFQLVSWLHPQFTINCLSPIVLFLSIVFVFERESIDCTHAHTQIGQDNCSWSHQHRHHLVTVTVRARWYHIVMTTMTWWMTMTMKVMNQGQQQLQPMSWQYHRAETFDPTLWNSDHSHDTQQKREREVTHTHTHAHNWRRKTYGCIEGDTRFCANLDLIQSFVTHICECMTNRNSIPDIIMWSRSEFDQKNDNSTHTHGCTPRHSSKGLMIVHQSIQLSLTQRYILVHEQEARNTSLVRVLCAGLAHTMHEQ